MSKKKLFSMFILLCVTSGLFAQARYYVAKKIYDDPSVLTEPWFWIVVVICLVLVGIYAIVKDKGK